MSADAWKRYVEAVTIALHTREAQARIARLSLTGQLNGIEREYTTAVVAAKVRLELELGHGDNCPCGCGGDYLYHG